MGGLSCPGCGSDRLDRLARNDISPFRGYRCAGCGRRLRDRGSLPVYLTILVVSTAVAAAGGAATGEEAGVGRGVAVGTIGVVCAGYAAVELTRRTPSTARPVAPAPAGDWYVARDGGKVGPFAVDRLRAMAATGALTPADMVLDPCGGRWVSAGAVASLFEPTATAPPNPGGAAPTVPPPPPGNGRRVAFAAAAVAVGGLGLALAVRGGGAGDKGGPLPAPAGEALVPPAPAVERLTVGPGREILYSAGLGADAERLVRALGEAGYGEGKWPARVQLGRRGDTWVVELDLRPAVFDDPTTPAAMERWVGVRVAASAFPGGRVEMRLGETGGRERAAVRVEGAGRSPVGGSAAAVFSLGGAKAEGDRLADLLARGGLDTRVGWVILLAREPGGWVITPLNLRPAELVPGVRRRWAGLARAATAALAAPARVEVLGDDYRPAATLTAADETEPPR
ncbi:DUF4339 domain-containing protein [Urbifossiella limnaea]|uniref:GYF domain-containing protein n=1 Tax=Urbifossiella limnaea TaxID=2528023 RepID=A0A517XW38_9BACT|nr:DUF4339 domain-containing protein [Urbifossiella limnaea]QDU21732.1 hypothetical protein ETAA1_37050 [Urbifossiella limnaea]